MKIQKWNLEKDVLKENNHELTHWAYSINTDVGQYCMVRKLKEKKEVFENHFTIITHYEEVSINLKYNGLETTIMKNIVIWAHSFYRTFLIFHSIETGKVYLIDSRGILFELPIFYKDSFSYGSVNIDKKRGVYIVEKVEIKFRDKTEQKKFEESSMPILGVNFNKEFNKFVRTNAHNTNPYLYLSILENKVGNFIKYFIGEGMKYELVPNLLNDDDTINIRIPLFNGNELREDVQFLCAKYNDTYSIYGVPYNELCGALNLRSHREKLKYISDFYLPKGKEAIAFSIIETIRNATNAKDDYDVYKKSFSKIVRMLNQTTRYEINNVFSNKLLLYPKDFAVDVNYVNLKKEYIKELLLANKNKTYKDKEICNKSSYSINLYTVAYDESKKVYKTMMEEYESSIIASMIEQGYKFGKWKNEITLFTIIKREYPDAIYQYHATWLKQQSLDVYIPSIKVGVEYQGEQHYKAIDYFGGTTAFEKLKERDLKKKRLCEANNIKLICWRYDEVISKTMLQKKVEDILK